MNVVFPWVAEVVLISWRTVRRDKRPPLPSELLATFVVFGTASVIGTKYPEFATTFGWGIVIATALNFGGTEDQLLSPGRRTSAVSAGSGGTVRPI